MKLRNLLLGITACAVLGTVAGCSKKPAPEPVTNAPAADATPTPAPTPTPAAQPQAQPAQATQAQIDAIVFDRAYARAAGLTARKDYPNALQAIGVFKDYKLTPEQQAKVNALKAQIPGAR
jgi:predicted component of type VI protein secretion system